MVYSTIIDFIELSSFDLPVATKLDHSQSAIYYNISLSHVMLL